MFQANTANSGCRHFADPNYWGDNFYYWLRPAWYCIFFCGTISRPDGIGDLFVKACPLIIIATGLVFCFRANVWNIGAEGQLVLGAVFAGGVALAFPGWPAVILMPTMMLAGVIGGVCWAMIPALLKVRFNTNEILVSLMLTYVAALFIDWLVRGPWRDPMSFGFPLTKMYADAALINRIDLPIIGMLGQLHWELLRYCYQFRIVFVITPFWGIKSR